jgi:hypothetical protein
VGKAKARSASPSIVPADPPITPPVGAHEWVSFPDPEELRTWVFDVTFLLSNWDCIFGRGCQGVLTGPAEDLVQGCCSYGAHFTGTEDVERVEQAASKLTPDEWQFYNKGHTSSGRLKVTKTDKTGELTSRLADGACIFLNRPGFPTGPGCSLHQVAMTRGERPLDWKPDVCWQLPLRREDETDGTGYVTSTVRQWDRRHWGEGGEEFHWWCTEAPEAFIGSRPVYESMHDEIEALVGPVVCAMIVAELDRRRAQQQTLPHPAAVPVALTRRDT